MNNHLVYLKDDNGNSLECYEFVGDNDAAAIKEHDLMVKHNLTSDDYEFVPFNEFVKQIPEESEYAPSTDYPLVLVFYLDRELMENPQIIGPYAQSVNSVIAARKANIMAFFIPTDSEERIECINPKQVSKANMSKINNMVAEVAAKFEVGTVRLTEESIEDDDDIVTPGP
jgi:hypothetical protein